MKNAIRQILYGGSVPATLVAFWQTVKNHYEFTRAGKRLEGLEKYNLACGNNVMKGWANIDLYGPKEVIRWNLTRTFPVRAASVKYVFTEHFIEHIERLEALKLLREVYRLLIEGGCIRITTPNLSQVVASYNDDVLDEWVDVRWKPETPCRMMNEFFRSWDHKFVYDVRELEALLVQAGFSKIESLDWGQSSHEVFRGIEKRPYHGEIIMEATK